MSIGAKLPRGRRAESFFGHDTFTDAAGSLFTHVAEDGAGWTRHANALYVTGPGHRISNANRCYSDRGTTQGPNLAFHNIVPPSPDYYVRVRARYISVLAGSAIGVAVRQDPVADTHYLLWINPSGAIQLYKGIASVGTLLDDAVTVVPTPGLEQLWEIAAKGTLITCKLDGVIVLQANDGDIAAAGHAALRDFRLAGTDFSNTVGAHYDELWMGKT